MFINMKHWENARMRDQNNKQKRTHNFSHVPRLYLYVFFFILLVSQHFAVRQHGIASPTTSTPFADTASLWRLFWFRFHLNKCFVIWFSPTARSHRTILQCASHNTTMPGYTISWTSLIIALEEFLYFVFLRGFAAAIGRRCGVQPINGSFYLLFNIQTRSTTQKKREQH